MMDVLVKTRGVAIGMLPGGGLSDRAMEMATKLAEARAELWPCPNCGTRRLDGWRRDWIRGSILILLIIPVAWLVQYFVDPWSARQTYTIWIYLGVAVLFELLVAGAMLNELRASKTAVRPLVRDVPNEED